MAVIILCLCLACVPVLANSDVILVTDTTANPATITDVEDFLTLLFQQDSQNTIYPAQLSRWCRMEN